MSWLPDRGPRPDSVRRQTRRGHALRKLRRRPEIEGLEIRITPTTKTWTGTIDNIWTRGANWSGGVAPTAGDDLIFPSDATRFTSANNFAVGTAFGSITVQSANYDILGNAVVMTGPVSLSYPSGGSAIELDLNLSGAGMNVDGGGTVDMTGAISGPGGILVTGGSTAILEGISANTYTGTTTVDNGSLLLQKSGGTAVSGNLVVGGGAGPATATLGADDQIADSASVTVDPSGSLTLNDFSDAIGSLNLTGTSVSTGAGTLTLIGDLTTNTSASQARLDGHLALGAGPHTFSIADPVAGSTPDVDIAAVVGGPGGIVKTGTGNLRLSASNTFTGAFDVQAGLVTVSDDGALGSPLGDTTVEAGAALELIGDRSISEPIVIAGAGGSNGGAIHSPSGSSTLFGTITLSADSAIGVDSGVLTIVGQITDGVSSYALAKVSGGTLALTNANPYDGSTTVGAGIVTVSNGGALGTGAADVASGAALEIAGGITLSNAITVRGAGIAGDGALRSTSGDNVLGGPLTLGADGTAIGVDAGGKLQVSFGVGDSGAGYSLTKVGAGVLDLDSGNSFTGDLDVVAGTVEVGGGIDGAANLDGGTLSGAGQVNGIHTSAGGVVAPGPIGGAGVLTSIGSLDFTSDDTLAVELNGISPGTQYDQLAITGGTASLGDAALSVSLGYIPTIGDTFTILDNTSENPISGTFNGLAEGATFTVGNVTFKLSYAGGDGDDVTLTVTAVTYTWTGAGGDSNWSTGANWDVGVAPTPGSGLVFPAGASQIVSNNDLPGIRTYNSITISGAGYDLAGNGIGLTGGFFVGSGDSVNVILDLTMVGTQTFDVAAGGLLYDYGSIAGAGAGLAKSGDGTLALFNNTADNTYDGATTVLDGTLLLGSSHIAIPGALIVGDGVGSGETVQYQASNEIADSATVTLNEGATFDFNGQSDQFNSLVMQGATVLTNGGTISVLTSITVNPAASHAVSTIQGPGSLDLASDDVVFAIADDPALPVELRVSAGAVDGAITKTGAGVLALSGANTYDGTTTVNAGAIQVESSDALGSTAGDTTVASGASVTFLGNGLTVPESFVIAGSGMSGIGVLYDLSGSAALSGTVALTADATVGAADHATLEFRGALTDAPTPRTLTVTNGTAGRTTLAEDGSNFQGSIVATTGFLRVGTDSGLGSGATSVTFKNSASLELEGGITIPATKTLIVQLNGVLISSKIVNITGDNTIASPVVFAGNTDILVNPGSSLTVSGVISESFVGRRLIKVGAGDLILAATNTYSGTTFVDDGALLVDGSIAASSDVQIYGGALGGTGTTPRMTANSAGAIAPGDASTGILSTGNVALNTGSAFEVDINGPTAGTGYDQLDVTGTVSLVNASLATTLGYSTTLGDTFIILNNDGSDPVAGTFNGLNEGDVFQVGNQPFQISYVGGDGNDVTLTALNRIDKWTGLGATTNWSDGGNWLGGVAPTAGDDLTFPAGASKLGNSNDFLPGTAFGSITIAGSGYFITGASVVLSGGLSATYASGTSVFGTMIALGADQTFDVASGGELDVIGGVTGAHSLTKSGAGTLVFALGSSYSGGTSIDDGVVKIFNGGALGSGLATISYPGELQLTGNITVSTNIQNRSSGTGIRSVSGSNTISGAIDLYENATFDVAASSSLRLSGLISQSNPNRSLTKAGAGTLQIDGASTYSGGTDIRSGTLTVTNSQALGTNGLIYDESDATLLIAAPTFNVPSGGIFMGGNPGYSSITINDALAHTLNGNFLLIGNANFDVLGGGSLNVAGNIGGTGTVTLSSSSDGTLVLSGTSSYSGKTFVAGGTVEVDGNFSSSGELDLTGGTLDGTGQVGNVVATGGTLAPGLATGILSAGQVSLSPGATFGGVISGPMAGTDYGQLVTSGPVSLGDAMLGFAPGGPYTPAAGTVFTLIDNQGGSAVSGTFFGLNEGDVYANSGQAYRVSYVGGDGNDVTLTSVVVTNTAVTTSVASPVYGQMVTFTAEVSGVGGSPTGSVVFKDNGVPLPAGTVTLADVAGHEVATYTTSALAVGQHTITADFGTSVNFVGSSGALSGNPLVVGPADTTVGVDTSDASPIYGESVLFTALVTASAPGAGLPTGSIAFYDGDPDTTGVFIGIGPVNSLGVATLSVANLSVAASPHSIIAVYIPNTGDFSVSTSTAAPVLESVQKANLIVHADDQSREYGDANPALTYSIQGFVNGETLATSGVTGTPDISTSATPTSPVAGGPYAISVTTGTFAASNYTFTFADGSLTITPATLTVLANDLSREYGDANPTLTATFSGFKNGETLATSDVTGAPDLATAATPASPVAGGPYAIVASAGTISSGNYAFQFIDGKLAITRAALTVAADDQSREYGDANPALTYTIAGFKNGETQATSDLTGAPSVFSDAIATSPVSGSPYAIAAAPGSLASGNYAISFVGGALTVTKAHLTVAADDQSREYGDANPALTYAIRGFKNGEVLATSGVAGLADVSTAATPTSPVAGGPYTIAVTAGTLAAGNYDFQLVDGELDVTPARLTVAADPQSRLYGDANPTLTATFSGFKNGETLATSGVTGAPGLATPAAPTSPVAGGPYTISASAGTLAAGNYDFRLVDGALTVTPATLTVRANDQSREYGDANPALDGTITGFVNGEVLGTSGVTGSPLFSTSASPASPVSGTPYTITTGLNTLAASNYVFTAVDGKLAITPARLTVAADPQSRLYGDANPTLTATFSGFKNGETLATSGVTGAPGLATAASPTSPVSGSPYAVQASLGTLAAGNYDFSFIDGELVINPAHLTVTASDASRVYGDPNPTFGYAIAGLKNGETLATGGVTGAPNLSTLANPSSPVSGSPYAISASAGTLAAGNYDFSFIDGHLALSKAPLTITANDQSKVFGQGVPTPTATYSGFKNGETAASLASQPVLSTSATATSPVSGGPYAITVGGAASGNYTIGYADGTLTVGQAATSVTLSAPSSAVYGQGLTLGVRVDPIAPGAGLPTGVVAFYDGTTSLGSAALNGGSASIHLGGLPVGSHGLTVVYSGDANFAGSHTAATILGVTPAQTSLGLTVPSAIVAGQSVTLVAGLNTLSPGTGAADGMVQFLDGGVPIGTAPIVNGAAVLPTTFATVGTHSLQAIYAGGTSFAPASSPTAAVSVGMATAQVVLTLSPFPAVTGQTIALTANVNAASPSGTTPTGTVTFLDNGVTLGVATLANGQAVLQVPAAHAGTPQTITAVYSGDARFFGQVSNGATETVSPATTATTLTLAPVGPAHRRVQLAATVTSVAPGSGVPNGRVVFFRDGRKFRTQTLVNGQAAITIPTRAALNHTYRVRYRVSGDYQTSYSQVARAGRSPSVAANWVAKLHQMRAWRTGAKH